VQKIKAIDIAIEQLETAMDLYESEGPSVSVITLAAAAEEIFGKLAREKGKSNHMMEMIDSCKKVHLALTGEALPDKFVATRENEIRNYLKHANPVKQPELCVDVKAECNEMLSRAIVNYQLCQSSYTPKIGRFIAQVFNPNA
tara:strand:+ start:4507 stop:4935 length:429 start_codon:yes stop_codon:yes gene_type:complete